MSQQSRLRFRCVALATHFFLEGEEPMKKKIILFLVSTVIALSLTGCKSGDYNEAVKLQEAGDYQAALELYESIEDYENYKDLPNV